MSRSNRTTDAMRDRIQAVTNMNRNQCLELWRESFASPPAKYLSQPFMQKAIAVDLVEERKGKSKYRYEGPFLDFVEQFLFLVDFAEIERNSRSGLHDRVRKFAAKRKKDPDFFQLLHQESVPPEAVLEFMKRADAIK